MDTLNKYRIEYRQQPYNHNPLRVAFVMAENERDAIALLRMKIERDEGIPGMDFKMVAKLCEEKLIQGRVL